MKITRTKLFVGLLIAAVTAALHHYTAFVDLNGQYREMASMDTWFRMREPRKPPKELLIVRLDEETYRRLGLSVVESFPRKKLAELIRKLAQLGAAGAALDIALVHKPERGESDGELAEALELLPSIVGQYSLKNLGQTPEGKWEPWSQEVTTDPYFIRPNVKVGDLTMPIDNYIARRFKNGPGAAPPMSEIAASFLRGAPRVPGNRDLIDFYGPAGAIPSIPAYRLLDSAEPVEDSLIRGKLVFVGFVLTSRATGESQDAFATPLAPRVYGVEIHATAAGNVLERKWIKRLTPVWEQALLAAVLLPAAFAFWVLPFRQSALICLGLIVLRFYGGYAVFNRGLFIPGIHATNYFLPGAFIVGWFFNFVEAQKKRAVLRDCLSRYLNPQMAHKLEAAGELSRPAVERREIAVLFTDITRYTRLSELSPEGRTGELLNKYLPVIAECGMVEGGVVLKSAGDGGLIIWGAPLDVEAPCERALRTALAIEERLKTEIAARRLPPLKTRFGAAFGLADVGNVGSEDHFDYTAEGDTVNVAARLVNIAARLGVSILISDSLVQKLENRENLFLLGAVRVKGRRGPVKVHTVFDFPVSGDVLDIWTRALHLFSRREWEECAVLFNKAGSLDKRLKKAGRIYSFQARRFQRREPFSRWAGELIMRSK